MKRLPRTTRKGRKFARVLAQEFASIRKEAALYYRLGLYLQNRT